MASVISEVSSKGYEVIAYVGAAHVKSITNLVNTEKLEKHKTSMKTRVQTPTGTFVDQVKQQTNSSQRGV